MSCTPQLYGIARFISYGGSWHSFYMFTGGNNYGRQAGGDVITAYAPDTVLSNYLLRHRGERLISSALLCFLCLIVAVRWHLQAGGGATNSFSA